MRDFPHFWIFLEFLGRTADGVQLAVSSLVPISGSYFPREARRSGLSIVEKLLQSGGRPGMPPAGFLRRKKNAQVISTYLWGGNRKEKKDM